MGWTLQGSKVVGSGPQVPAETDASAIFHYRMTTSAFLKQDSKVASYSNSCLQFAVTLVAQFLLEPTQSKR